MSLRKMLKVSLLMLLAMALAATSAHARLNQFGQLLTSKNQPNPNSEGVLQVLVKGKGKSNVDDEPSGAIPYTECINTCDTCFCTLKWPPESNICICGDNIKSKNPAAAVQEVKSSSSKVKSEVLPYYECIEKCKYHCACTLIWPPELSTCVCSELIESTAAKAIDADEVEELHKELDLLSKPLEKSGGGFIPYPECIKKCDECVICTKIYPIEKAWCYCENASNSKKPAIQNSEEVQVLVKGGKGKLDVDDEPSGTIPYTECINTCDLCFCTRKWPPESNMCICVNNSKSMEPATAVQVVESSSSKVKSEIIPYSDCMENCKHVCACTLIWPPELSTCICSDHMESTTDKVAEKLHKTLDLISKPVAKLGGGFIPYPECIKKCDECVICTKNYPIEEAFCYCENASNSKKLAIQNSGDDKKMVLRTKAKLDRIPYYECIQTCETCLCDRRAPEYAMCTCMDPKAAGRALPI